MAGVTGLSITARLYNYLELRAELEAAGHRFVSHCDTEVILAAYAQWGAACLSRFNGMWALAIYDVEKETLLLARDRFGIKPLYYWVNEARWRLRPKSRRSPACPAGARGRTDRRCMIFCCHPCRTTAAKRCLRGCSSLSREPARRWIAGNGGGRTAREAGALKIHRWYEFEPRLFAGTFEEAAVAISRTAD